MQRHNFEPLHIPFQGNGDCGLWKSFVFQLTIKNTVADSLPHNGIFHFFYSILSSPVAFINLITSSMVFPDATKALNSSSFCFSSISFWISFALWRSYFKSDSFVRISCSTYSSCSSKDVFSSFFRLAIMHPPNNFSSFYHILSTLKR